MTGRTPKLHSCLCLWQSTMSCWKLLHLFQSISPFKDIHKCSLWGMSSISQRPIPLFDSSFAGTFFWLLSISVGIHCLAKHLQCQASKHKRVCWLSQRQNSRQLKSKGGLHSLEDVSSNIWKESYNILYIAWIYLTHTDRYIYIYMCVCDSHIYNMNIYNYI